jgi:hypothetical protein
MWNTMSLRCRVCASHDAEEQRGCQVKHERDRAAAISTVLRVSEPRPEPYDRPTDKNQYAVRFANAMAESIARDLEGRFPGIEASPRRTAASAGAKTKQLDVNFSTPQLGLALGISLKSVHVRDVKAPHRYTHNMKRNEEELRIEASGYHRRQPFAVMLGVIFLPFDSCDDGLRANPSSFGSWVRHLRPYTGRVDPKNDVDRFERIFIALYEPDGSDLKFFDAAIDPPRNGRPQRLLSYAEFLDSVWDAYAARNLVRFKWADGEEEIVDVDETEDGET